MSSILSFSFKPTETAGEKNVQRRTMSAEIFFPILLSVMITMVYLVIQIAMVMPVTVPFGLQLLFELAASLFFLDLFTGLVHLNFDYQAIQNKELYLHTERDVPGIQRFNKHDPLFLTASKEDQFLWNFLVHHDVPYPAADTDYDLVMQIGKPVMAIPVSLALAYSVGLTLPGFLLRVILTLSALAPATNHIHIWAHARTRNLIRSPIWRFLQDYHLVLNPDVHKKHHTEYDCNFCLVNGWANPVVNRLAALMRHVGLLVDEPPTITMRRQRDLHVAAKELTAVHEKKAADATISEPTPTESYLSIIARHLTLGSGKVPAGSAPKHRRD